MASRRLRWLRWLGWSVAGLLVLCVSLALLYGLGWWVRSLERPPREPLQVDLAGGARYERIVWDIPRPVLWHVVTIPLTDTTEFVLTPPQPSSALETLAQTTSQFAESQTVDIAINGSYFKPHHATHLLDYYPRAGDPVDIHGPARTNGVTLSDEPRVDPMACLTWDGRRLTITSDQPAPTATDVITGLPRVLWNGRRVGPMHTTRTYARVAAGIDPEGQTLWLVAVDGSQSGYSEGVTYLELADFLMDLGATDALALDGGGSTTLVLRDSDGAWQVVNAPYHTHIPMRERPVANHLGIRLGAKER